MNKKIGFIIGLMFIALPFSMTASASDQNGRSIEDVYKQCGLGGLILGNSSSILAIISNVTWDLGTTAALSDASSAESGCISPTAAAAVFIDRTITSLEADLSKGEGEHLSALSQIMNCSSSDTLRSSYGEFVMSGEYASSTTSEKAEKLFSIVDQKMSSSECSA